MRMAAHEFVANRSHDIIRSERALRPRKLGLKYNLQQEVAEFGAELLSVSAVDSVDDLARFFERISAQRRQCLLSIPRASIGREQAEHQLDQAWERRAG